jgi:hypothetical protein
MLLVICAGHDIWDLAGLFVRDARACQHPGMRSSSKFQWGLKLCRVTVIGFIFIAGSALNKAINALPTLSALNGYGCIALGQSMQPRCLSKSRITLRCN